MVTRRNRRTGFLAAFVAIVAMLAGMQSAVAAGQSAYELNHSRGKEIVLANLGTFPAILVLPGSTKGTQLWSSKRIPAGAVGVNHFKDSQVGSGDLDGDGDGDLVISVPRAARAGRQLAGKVVVVPGAQGGPDTERSYTVTNPSSTTTRFGKQLLVANLDGDGFQDAAVVADNSGRPRVTILWGRRSPMTRSYSKTFNGPAGGVTELVSADFDGDGARELTLVYGGRAKTSTRDAIRGRIVRCEVRRSRSVSCARARRTASGIVAAATGDVAGTSTADLVLGQPRNDTGRGRVLVYRGSRTGLSDPAFVSQDSAGVPGTDSRGDRFGAALAIDDMDRDGYGDVAIGSPGEATGGRVTILYGHRDGLGQGRSAAVDQDSPEVPGSDERGDNFGESVSLLDVDGDGRPDLVAGVPGEDADVGAIVIIRTNDGGKPNLAKATRAKPEDVGIGHAGCCGQLRLGNRIGK